jgi:hypothetical protein
MDLSIEKVSFSKHLKKQGENIENNKRSFVIFFPAVSTFDL